MAFSKYIRQLLNERKLVVLPGFGSLQVKEAFTEIPGEGGKIRPPGAMIKFDASYSKDNGLLAEACSNGEEISVEEANQRVLELVDDIKFALDRGENYVLKDAGIITRDDDGRVSFQADPDWLLDPDQFGLSSMDLIELDESPQEPERTEESSPPEKTYSYYATAEKEPEKRAVNKWKIIWIVVGSLIVVLVLLMLIPVQTGENGGLEFGKEGITLKKTEIKPGSEPDQNIQESDVTKEIGNDQAAQDEPAQEQPEETARKNFFIIAGSFQHLQNASELQDKLIQQGYPSEILITENRLYRVSVLSFTTKEEAVQSLGKVKQAPGLENSWVLSN